MVTKFSLEIKRKPSWKNTVALNISYFSQNPTTDCNISKSHACWCNSIWCNLVWPNTVLLKGLRQETIYRAPACCNTLILHRNENITVVFEVYIFILISGTEVKLFAFQRPQSSMWGLKYSQEAEYSSIPPVTNYLSLSSHAHTRLRCACCCFNTLWLSCKWEIL